MKFDDSVLTPALGQSVLKALQRLTPLPATGIVAGQSVASALDEVLGIAAPVYNDVDCFVPAVNTRDEATLEWERRSANGTVTYWSEQELESSGYQELIEAQRRQLYHITRTRRDGLLNTVDVSWSWGTYGAQTTRAQDLISVFDINATQAAVDLGTSELVVTPAFRAYFKTRQLQLENLFTPVHSLLRLLKKAQELPLAYVDLTQSMRMVHETVKSGQGPKWLADLRQDGVRKGSVFVDQDELQKHNWPCLPDVNHPQGRWIRVGQSLQQTPLCFGNKYRSLYERHAQKMDGLFELSENPKGNLWLARAKAFEYGPKAKGPLNLYFSGCSPAKAAKQYRQWAAPQRVRASERHERFERWCALIKEPKYQALLQKAYRLTGDEYLEGLDSDKHMHEVARVQNEHPEFFWAAVALPFVQQHRLIRALRKEFKACQLPEAWGVLHDKSSHDSLRLLQDPQALQELVRELIGSNTPYIAALPLPETVTVPATESSQAVTVEVVQLLTQLELNAEGAKMSHCVAGYGPSVRSFRCRILSFRAGPRANQRATAEWVFKENRDAPAFCQVKREDGAVLSVYPLMVSGQQLRSVCNETPSRTLEEAEALALESVNQSLAQMGAESWELLRPGALEYHLVDLQGKRIKAPLSLQSATGFMMGEDIPW